MRPIPKTEIADPTRTKLRKDKELPMWMKSTTESEDPNRLAPKTEMDDAKRLKERNDMELPI
jgi:hypothetical protein